LGVYERLSEDSLETKVRKTYTWKHALLGLMAMKYGFYSTQISLVYCLHSTATTTATPTPTPKSSNAIPDATGDFLFLALPSPQKGGRGGVGARSSKKISSYRSSSSSAHQGKRGKYR
jgi:hypothetical protein